ncbi:hypothetical protein NPD7_750 [Clostridium sporogenes]|uniref:Ig-like domain-containing protein n=1 Tax=Clostridium TaxID=1485 RepID=UPI00090AD87C|nr:MULTISPECIES: Ig-like domain-containing protein [Clostridium]APF27814.1 hypothetical protein NPD7_750 [Clostridium sporogenes]MDI6918461.1 hypothetical protein [Clostridium botulinum]WMU96408.1 hypothetical protein QA656_11560 [Clostridium botulinum]
MLSKRTKRIITSAILSLTVSLSFLGSSIKEVKAFGKTSYQERIDSIGKNHELQYEISALVVDLENSDVIDSNKFEKLKEMLNNAPEEFVKEFKAPYNKIQKRYEIENLIKGAEGNLTEEKQAEYESKLQVATKAVEKAENNKNQTDVDSARALVNILNDTDTDNLNDKLSVVQRFIDKNKVEQESNEAYKVTLTNANEAVLKAENSQLQIDVNNARTLVNNIKDLHKSGLNTRLDTVQEAINNKKAAEENEYELKVKNAIKAVEKAEKTNMYEDYINATKLALELKILGIRTDLWDRLGEVKINIGRNEEATRLVKLAEEDNTETNYNRALESINRLRDNELKKDLLNRLNKVKTTIDNNKAKEEEKAKNQRALEEAIKVVEQAERENEEKSYSEALVIVNVLEESASKKELLDRLYEVKINIENIKTNKAIELVKYAERYPSITSYNNAKDAVNVIRDGNIKSELLNNLKNVEDRIKKLDKETEKKQFLEYVDSLVKKAEDIGTDDSYKKALQRVENIEDIESRKVYINRLKEIKDNIDRNTENQVNILKSKLKEVSFQFDLDISEINQLKIKANNIDDKNEKNKMMKKINKLERKYNKIKNDKEVKEKVNKIKKYDKWGKVFADIKHDKTFTVGFNREINDKFINKDNIYILDADELQKIDAKVEIDNKKLKISSKNLEKGTNYIVIISDRIKSKGNQKLKNPIKVYVYTSYED